MMQAEIEEFADLFARDAARAEEALIRRGNPIDLLSVYTDDVDASDYADYPAKKFVPYAEGGKDKTNG